MRLGPSTASIAETLLASADPDDRRTARLVLRDETLCHRLAMRRAQSASKLADALAKFGGGSLLTATLLLIIGGRADSAVVVTAALALLLFVFATILLSHYDRRATHREFQAEQIEAALKETERSS